MDKNAKIELESMNDLEKMISEAERMGVKVIIIGGYAVRAYTPKTIRYSKDIDFFVQSEDDFQKLKSVLAKLKYKFRIAKHGMSGFKRSEGVPIVLNISIGNLSHHKRKIRAVHSDKEVTANIIDIEHLLINKLVVGRDKDLIDACIILLDSHELIDRNQLKKFLIKSGRKDEFISKIKNLVDMIITRNFREIWRGFIGRDITRDEVSELRNIMVRLSKV